MSAIILVLAFFVVWTLGMVVIAGAGAILDRLIQRYADQTVGRRR